MKKKKKNEMKIQRENEKCRKKDELFKHIMWLNTSVYILNINVVK